MPALNRTWGATLVLLAALTIVSNASAGHPHWGGVGLGYSAYHYGYGGYRSLGIYRPIVWGGYPGLGYTSTIRLGYGSLGYRGLRYGGLGYRSWVTRPLGYSSFYANYYAPSVTVYAPSATYYVPSATYFVPSVIDYAPSYCAPNFCNECVSSVESPIDIGPTFVPTSTMSYSAAASRASASDIPASLLKAADAVFEAGGYRQAARAYAQLHVQYGSSDQIFERRFVAQVACGDYDQAAVVLASAQGAGFPFERLTTTDSDWNQLFAGRSDLVQGWTESLAQHALQAVAERESLEMMATWLNLTGQSERAGLFLAMAEQMSLEAANPTQPANSVIEMEELPLPPSSKSALVSLQH